MLVLLFLHFADHGFDTAVLQNAHHIIVHRFRLGSGAGGFVDDFSGGKIDADCITAFYKGVNSFACDGGYAQVDGVAIEDAAKSGVASTFLMRQAIRKEDNIAALSVQPVQTIHTGIVTRRDRPVYSDETRLFRFIRQVFQS